MTDSSTSIARAHPAMAAPHFPHPRRAGGIVVGGSIVLVLLLVLPTTTALRLGAPPAAPMPGPHRAVLGSGPALLHPSQVGVLNPIRTARLVIGTPSTGSPGGPSLPAPAGRAALTPGPSAAASAVTGSFAATPLGSSQALVGRGFTGIDDAQCGCDPPDVQVAAGPHQIAEMVNLYLGVWSPQGVLLAGEGLSSFYSTSNYLSDPRIVYDNLSGRFFASILAIGSNVGYVYFAVSGDSNATGNWTIYKVIATPVGTFPDQPMLGVNGTMVGLAGNAFSSSAYAGAEWWVVNKSALLAGGSASYASFGPSPNDFSVHPARSDRAGAPFYFVETFSGSVGPVELFRVSGTPPAVVTISTENVSVGTISDPPPVDTPAGGQISPGSSRVAEAIWWGGRLYVTYGDACAAGPATFSCLRLDVFNVTTSPATVIQDFDLRLPSTGLYYPAIAIDGSGNLLLVFGASSASIDPGVVAAVHRAGDPAATISPFVWVQPGSAGRSSAACGGSVCRFGDYFGAGPTPNGSGAWIAGEYLTPSATWQTWVAPVWAAPPPTVQLTTASVVEVGAPAAVGLNVTTPPCGVGLVVYCTVTLPLGNGSTASWPCGAITGPLTASVTFDSAGQYPVGAGGSVDLYSSSSCTAASQIGSLPIPERNVTVAPGPTLTVASSVGPAGDVGQAVQFTATPVGGVPPYSAAWSQLPTGCLGGSALIASCTPTGPGQFNVTAHIADAVGGATGASVAYRVDPAPTVSLAADRTVVDRGVNLSFSGNASGGSGGFHYRWYGLPAGCLDVNAASQRCAPTVEGNYTVAVEATDSRGVTATSANVSLEVVAPVGVTLTAQPNPVASGGSVTVRANITGGAAPFAYAWSGLPAGCTGGSSATVSCTADRSFTVTVSVHDAGGGVAAATLTVELAASSASTTFQLLLYAAVGAALVAAAAAVVMLLRVRRKRQTPGPPRT